MSLIPFGLPVLAATLQDLLSPVFIRTRNIGGFIADCTVEENHIDELAITEHPVEQGAAITDHSYKRPAMVSIKAGWSNSSFSGGGDPNYVQEIYAAFLQLQASREPFDVVTGKRTYFNMLVHRLAQTTNKDTENSMLLTVDCREIIITNTQVVPIGDGTNMDQPQLNAPTQTLGVQQLQPAPNYNATATP